MTTFTRKESNHNIRKQFSFIEAVDTVILIIYVLCILFSAKMFLNFDYGMGSDFAQYLFIVRCVLLAVASIKVFYYLAFSPVYSFASIILFSWILVLFEIKNRWDIEFSELIGSSLVMIVIMIISMYRIPFHRIIKSYLISFGTFFVIRILGTVVNILPSNHYIIEGRGELTDFGFGHHNITLLVFFFLASAWLYIIRGKQYKEKIIHCLIISAVVLILFLNTTSRTSTIIILSMCLGIILYQIVQLRFSPNEILDRIMVWIRRIMLFGPIESVLITFAGMLFYNGYRHFFGKPHFLTTMFQRFKCFSEDCALHGIKLPWQFVKESKCEGASFNWLVGDVSKAPYCDNLYHSLFISCGIIVFILVVVLFQYLAYKAYRKQDDVILLIVFGISILSIMEPTAMELTKNPFLLLAFAQWDPSGKELLMDESTHVSYKQQIKNTLGAIGNRKYMVFAVIALYIAVVPMLSVMFAYQIDTNDVSDFFFWWILITVMLMHAFYLFAGGHRFEYTEIPSVFDFIRRYRNRTIITIVILLLASIIVFFYTIKISTYDVETNDTRMTDGVVIRDNVSYRQVLPIRDSGLKKITLYFDNYGDRIADVQLYLYNANKTKNAYIPVDVSNANENGAIELDMSSGDFLKGQILCVDFLIVPNSWECAPVLTGVVYTFKDSIPILKCILICIPFYLLIDLIWMIPTVLGLVRKK